MSAEAAVESPVNQAGREEANEKAPEPADQPPPPPPAPLTGQLDFPPFEELAAKIADIHKKEAETGKKHIPFEHPLPECKLVTKPKLTDDQRAKYKQVLQHCEEIESLPVSTVKAAESQPLSDDEKMWLTEECILRYLRATKWNPTQAKNRIEATLIWRREYGVDSRMREEIEPENLTGKQWVLGYDNNARPCLHLNPARQNTDPSPRQIQHLVWMLERSIDMMDPGCETLSLLIDFLKSSSSKSPSVSTGRLTLHILQNYYPERLGKALCVNLPWFVWTFFKLITPFIDPLTKQKLVFDEPLSNHVPIAQLEKRFGGDVDFEYVHEDYWYTMNEMCLKRRADMRVRWKALGSKIGSSEFLIRGGKPEEEELVEGAQKLNVES